jgi:hypothetical protein
MPQQLRSRVAQLSTRHDGIDHSMLKQELGGLESLG